MAWHSASLNTLVLNLAYAQLERLLSDYIHNDRSFTVCGLVDGDSLETAVIIAATALFKVDAPDDPSPGNRFVVVPTGTGRSRKIALYRGLNECHRCILLYEEFEEVPDVVTDGADAVIKLGSFSKDDFSVAFRKFLSHSLADDDAELLVTVPHDILDFSFRPHQSFAEGLARVHAIHKARDLRRAADEGRKSPTRPVDSAPTYDTLLEQLVGYGEAKAWAMLLRDEIGRVRKYQLSLEDLDRGVVLSGPPGTGKSQFAKIVAEACRIPLFEASYAEWQKAGHMGDQLSAMDSTFKDASAVAPCILLIDELDSFSDRDKTDSEYTAKVVNGLLQLLDGPSRKPGVIVIGTTNNISKVDKAILRSGRFSEVFELQLPNAQERLAIAEQYLGEPVPNDIVFEFTDATSDLPGDYIKHLVRKAKRYVRTNESKSLSEGIREQLPVYVPLSPDRQYALAVHECGHALVALRLGVAIDSIFITDRIRKDKFRTTGGRLKTLEDDFDRITAKDVQRKIAVCLGGIAAESILLGGHDAGSGGSEGSDLINATDLATIYEACLGMGKTQASEILKSPHDLRWYRQAYPETRRRIEELLSEQRKLTEQLIFAERSLLDALARELVTKKLMPGTEIQAFVDNFKGYASGTRGWSLPDRDAAE